MKKFKVTFLMSPFLAVLFFSKTADAQNVRVTEDEIQYVDSCLDIIRPSNPTVDRVAACYSIKDQFSLECLNMIARSNPSAERILSCSVISNSFAGECVETISRYNPSADQISACSWIVNNSALNCLRRSGNATADRIRGCASK